MLPSEDEPGKEGPDEVAGEPERPDQVDGVDVHVNGLGQVRLHGAHL